MGTTTALTEATVGPVQPGQCRQLRALLWQEWRQARAVLLIAAALPVLGFAGVLVWRADELLPVAWFYTIMSGLLIGAGVGGVDPRNAEFLRTKPMPLGLVWRVKFMLGLATAAVVGIMSFLLTDLACRLAAGADRASIWLIWGCLAAFLPAFYSAGWAKSLIVAIGASAASGFAIVMCWRVAPFEYYLPPSVTLGTGAVLLLAFVPMSRACFVWCTRRGGSIKKRYVLGWFALPLVMLGVLPLAGSIGWVRMDAARLDPTDFSSMRIAGFNRLRAEVWLLAAPSSKFLYDGVYRWYLNSDPMRVFRVSLDSGNIRRAAALVRVWAFWSGGPSPSGRRLVFKASPANWADPAADIRPGLVVYDTDMDQSREVVANVSWRTQTHWLSGDRLLFVWVDPDDGSVLHWGQWQPGQEGADLRRVSSGGIGGSCRVVGFRSNPMEVVMASWSRPPTFWQVRLDTGETRRYVAPDHTELQDVYPKAGIAVLKQVLQAPTQRFSKHQPLVMDLATGTCQTVDDFVGARLKWVGSKGSARLSKDERWMIVELAKQGARPRRPNLYGTEWYLFDLKERRLFRQPLPQPSGGGFVYESSPNGARRLAGIIASRRDSDESPWPSSCLIVFDPRNSAPSAHLIVDGSASAHVLDFQWISDHEIVLCLKDEGRGLRRSPVPGVLKFWAGRSGVYLVDIDAMSVRPVWPKEGMGLKVSITTWPEWKRSNP